MLFLLHHLLIKIAQLIIMQSLINIIKFDNFGGKLSKQHGRTLRYYET